ncbi:MAG: hypothetical protein MR659_05160 [Mollicutes bacterium]|nr:hypothetical protein [Mollicutes bacterium]MDD7714774.1 hypothetical protein [Mollicutes bacterium]
MNKKTNVFLGLATTILALVAIFVLFSTAFGKEGGAASVRGNVFYIMFGSEKRSLSMVPGLITAFALLLLGTLTALISSLLPGKSATIGFGITLVALAAAGVLFIFGPNMYAAANDLSSLTSTKELTLGPGLICGAVFSFLGALLSLYGTYSSIKA